MKESLAEEMIRRYGVSGALRHLAHAIDDKAKAMRPKIEARLGYAREVQQDYYLASRYIKKVAGKIANTANRAGF